MTLGQPHRTEGKQQQWHWNRGTYFSTAEKWHCRDFGHWRRGSKEESRITPRFPTWVPQWRVAKIYEKEQGFGE